MTIHTAYSIIDALGSAAFILGLLFVAMLFVAYCDNIIIFLAHLNAKTLTQIIGAMFVIVSVIYCIGCLARKEQERVNENHKILEQRKLDQGPHGEGHPR